MKLGWKEFAIIFVLILVAGIALMALVPQTIEVDEKSGKQKIKNNILTIKAKK